MGPIADIMRNNAVPDGQRTYFSPSRDDGQTIAPPSDEPAEEQAGGGPAAFVDWGKTAVARQRAVERHIAESRRRFAESATDRLQAEMQRKRERRGDEFRRVPRKRGQRR